MELIKHHNILLILPNRDGELSTKDIQKLVHALPQYSEQLDKISLHVEVSALLLV